MSKAKKDNIYTASDTSIGFDYQFFYFFYLLMNIRFGETIGLEVKDDVHVDFKDGKTLLIQTKHSLQTNTKGETINLTERDKDLWKTLYNWITIVKDKADPIAYLNSTSFQLVTNKNNLANPFILSVIKVQNKSMTIAEFKVYVNSLIESTSDITIVGYMKDFVKTNSATLKQFIEKLLFELDEDNLIDRIKQRLLEKIHLAEKIDDVYNSLHSALRNSNYINVKSGKLIEIRFEEFNTKFRNCFKVGLSNKLPLRRYTLTIPEDPTSQLFIKQLLEIKDIKAGDKEMIMEYTSQMLRLYNNIKDWETKGELLASDLESFDKNSIQMWKNSFKSQYRGVTSLIELGYSADKVEKDIVKSALDCLDEMRKVILQIDETVLDVELSNGHFYLLTEQKQIGWRYDWKNKYL